MKSVKPKWLKEDKVLHKLDVRPIIESGEEPFSSIMDTQQTVSEGEIFLLINFFKPMPLFGVMSQMGFDSYMEELSDEEIHVYFYKIPDVDEKEEFADRQDESGASSLSPKEFQSLYERIRFHCQKIETTSLSDSKKKDKILNALDLLPRAEFLIVFDNQISDDVISGINAKRYHHRVSKMGCSDFRILIGKGEFPV